MLALVLVLGAAACTSSSPSSSPAQTTAPAVTTTTAAGPTTTYPTPPATPISIPRSTDGTSPDGSGCDPSTTTLSDGIWFGVLKSADASTNTIGLDLACWFSGQAAQAAAGSATPVPNDYYVRNLNPKVYELPASPQTAVLSLAQSGTGGNGQYNPTTVGLASANAILTDQSQHDVWVQITRGFVVVIQGQFTP